MHAWSDSTPFLLQLLYQARIATAQLRYFDHFSLLMTRYGVPKIARRDGYQGRLSLLRNQYRNKPCTVICNGPSLASVDPQLLRATVTIGCNGVYTRFPDWGFSTDFLVSEDIQQFEQRAEEISRLDGPFKLAALYNAYALRSHRDWTFFHAPRCYHSAYYGNPDDGFPLFSTDFASVVHLSSTVTYIMLQLAYHLGCDPVILVGLDFSYGKLAEFFPPGKLVITEELLPLVSKCHFDPSYYKVGDVIGVPWYEDQKRGYVKALEAFEAAGRCLVNATNNTQLDVIPVVSQAEYERLVRCDS